jgi:DHA2 family multidrug resistance protein-like MFS transporter
VGLAVTAVAMTAWWARLSATRPVMDLLRQRRFGLPVLALMLVASSTGLIVFAFPFFIADVLRQSPELLGGALLFFIGPASLVSPVAALAWSLGGGGVTGFHAAVLILAALTLAGCFTLLAARSRTA